MTATQQTPAMDLADRDDEQLTSDELPVIGGVQATERKITLREGVTELTRNSPSSGRNVRIPRPLTGFL